MTLELEKVLADIPFYIKLNIHPLNNNQFIIRIQDLYHTDDHETVKFVERVKNILKKPCSEQQRKCKYLKYHCKETLLGGLIKEEDDLNDKHFTSISHRIRTLFCQNLNG